MPKTKSGHVDMKTGDDISGLPKRVRNATRFSDILMLPLSDYGILKKIDRHFFECPSHQNHFS
jgi:hypothetical protein